jgi:tetratricopeptide (TPR) repeat protein
MREAGASVVFVTLSQNFADWPPGASSRRDDVPEAQRTAWEAHVAEGDRRAEAGDCAGALAAWSVALAIDDTHAGLVYRAASCERALGRFAAAAARYRRASDLDRVPHGAPTRYNEVLREVARAADAVLADADGARTAASPHGLVGDDLFVDFVHPNVRAHVLIADAVAEALRAAGIPAPARAWRAERWTAPDLEALYRADPTLRTKERLGRAVACLLARRDACAQAEADAVLAAEPTNAHARTIRAGLLRVRRRWGPEG